MHHFNLSTFQDPRRGKKGPDPRSLRTQEWSNGLQSLSIILQNYFSWLAIKKKKLIKLSCMIFVLEQAATSCE